MISRVYRYLAAIRQLFQTTFNNFTSLLIKHLFPFPSPLIVISSNGYIKMAIPIGLNNIALS